jgi:predicted nucleic acid-binding protein
LGAAFFSEKFTFNAVPLLEAIRREEIDAVAPVICISEFLNICRKKLTEGVSGAAVDGVIADFLTLPVVWFEIEQSFAMQSWNLYRSASIGTNDAFFVQLAQRMGAELWTIDGGLAANGPPVYGRIHDLRQSPFA